MPAAIHRQQGGRRARPSRRHRRSSWKARGRADQARKMILAPRQVVQFRHCFAGRRPSRQGLPTQGLTSLLTGGLSFNLRLRLSGTRLEPTGSHDQRQRAFRSGRSSARTKIGFLPCSSSEAVLQLGQRRHPCALRPPRFPPDAPQRSSWQRRQAGQRHRAKLGFEPRLHAFRRAPQQGATLCGRLCMFTSTRPGSQIDLGRGADQWRTLAHVGKVRHDCQPCLTPW